MNHISNFDEYLNENQMGMFDDLPVSRKKMNYNTISDASPGELAEEVMDTFRALMKINPLTGPDPNKLHLSNILVLVDPADPMLSDEAISEIENLNPSKVQVLNDPRDLDSIDMSKKIFVLGPDLFENAPDKTSYTGYIYPLTSRYIAPDPTMGAVMSSEPAKLPSSAVIVSFAPAPNEDLPKIQNLVDQTLRRRMVRTFRLVPGGV